MLRNLQNMSNVNVDASKKSAITADIKRGTFVQKDNVNKTFVLPTSIDELYLVDRDMVVTKASAMGEPYSDYDADQDTIKKDEFAGLLSLQKGVKWATTEYTVADADAVADKYLTVGITGADQGKLIASATATKIKSCGFYQDNGHKLLAFEILG